MSSPLPITPEAREYAAKELLRRAGFPGKAEIVVGPEETTIRLHSGASTAHSIVFPTHLRQLENEGLRTVKAAWPAPPAGHPAQSAAELIVPFCRDSAPEGAPLFRLEQPDMIRCSIDLLASILYSLCRVEELSGKRDEHGRFSALDSAAGRDSFLHRPVVDEYGLALQRAIAALLPGWIAPPRKLRVKVSHDIDLVGIPFSLRASAAHVLKRKQFTAALLDVRSQVSGADPAYLAAVREVSRLAQENSLDSAVYWKGSPHTSHDSGYAPEHPKVRRTMEWLRNRGVDQGVHPGYYTFANPEMLAGEVRRLQAAIGESSLGGRQHYLRWHPATWLDWESCGLAYDSSVGYADRPGFRSGTCIPYRPWMVAQNREARLLEIPLVLMEGTLIDYMHLDIGRAYDLAMQLVASCREVGGVFTLLWHNSSLLEPAYGDLYPQILKQIAGADRYDWKDDLAQNLRQRAS